MRILFVNHTAAVGGGERSLLDLLTVLRDDPGLELMLAVLAPGPLVELARELGIDTRVLPMPARVREIRRGRFSLNPLFLIGVALGLVPTIIALLRLIRREGIQVVYTNSPKSHVPGALAGRLAGRKAVCHYRDRFEGGATAWAFVRTVGLLAHRVIVNSRFVAEPFWAVWWVQRKVSVVYNGIDPDRLPGAHNARDRLLARYGLPDRSLLIGMVGRLDRWKGQEYFIRAGALVADRLPEARMLVIGGPTYDDPGYPESLRDLAEELGLSARVVFTGYVDEVLELMAGLDIVVHASYLAEPFGRVLIEAMALGKPVVAIGLGGPREIVLPGETGYLTPPRDFQAMAEAVLHLAAAPELRAAMGEAGRRRQVEFFHIRNTAAQVKAALGELV